jgi:hypothetical protein
MSISCKNLLKATLLMLFGSKRLFQKTYAFMATVMRSVSKNDLVQPLQGHGTLAACSFRFVSPAVWNSLSVNLRDFSLIPIHTAFKKYHCFTIAYTKQ